MNSRRTLAVMRWTLSVSALAGIVLVFHRWLHGVNPTTVALTLLLYVLVLAAEWGLRYAAVIAVLATACYNFYFLPPTGTFTISDPQNWLALFAFLATALLASRLSDKARDEAAAARARQRELEVLLHLSRELLHTESISDLLNSAPATVASVLSAPSALLYLLEGDRLFQAGNTSALDIERPHFRQLATTLSAPQIDGDELQLPLRSGVKPRGLLVIRGASLTISAAEAVAGLVSASIDRVQALESIARGEAAKESERLRNLMTDSITHELRTPLTSIKGAVSTLLTLPTSPESQRELLTVIDEESDRLNRLVSEALEMAQLDAQQVHMDFATVNVAQMMERARATCAWAEEQHAIIAKIPRDLSIRGDAEFLQKVFTNLIENAAKYSPPGTPITLAAEQKGSDVLISVADHGAGIEPAEQPLIFERFYRGRGHAEQTSGTGMGLAISRAILEAHAGALDVYSQPGRGSVFTVILPAV
jgi:two-component system sensor histidine kinase KdpD